MEGSRYHRQGRDDGLAAHHREPGPSARSVAVAANPDERVEVVAAHVAEPTERPGRKGSSADEAMNDGSADVRNLHEFPDGAPVLARRRPLHLRRRDVRPEVIRSDSVLVAEQMGPELTLRDLVVDGGDADAEAFRDVCDGQEEFGAEELVFSPPQIRRKLPRERVSTGSIPCIRYLLIPGRGMSVSRDGEAL